MESSPPRKETEIDPSSASLSPSLLKASRPSPFSCLLYARPGEGGLEKLVKQLRPDTDYGPRRSLPPRRRLLIPAKAKFARLYSPVGLPQQSKLQVRVCSLSVPCLASPDGWDRETLKRL